MSLLKESVSMATVAKGVKSIFRKDGLSRGSRPKYDWGKLMDGRVYTIRAGSDFKTNVLSFRVTAYSAAIRRGKRVSMISTSNKGEYQFQACDA